MEPGRTVAWDTKSSGARWIWELAPEGTGTRSCTGAGAAQLTPISKVFATVFLGGIAEHADELEAGMAESVARLKGGGGPRGR